MYIYVCNIARKARIARYAKGVAGIILGLFCYGCYRYQYIFAVSSQMR